MYTLYIHIMCTNSAEGNIRQMEESCGGNKNSECSLRKWKWCRSALAHQHTNTQQQHQYSSITVYDVVLVASNSKSPIKINVSLDYTRIPNFLQILYICSVRTRAQTTTAYSFIAARPFQPSCLVALPSHIVFGKCVLSYFFLCRFSTILTILCSMWLLGYWARLNFSSRIWVKSIITSKYTKHTHTERVILANKVSIYSGLINARRANQPTRIVLANNEFHLNSVKVTFFGTGNECLSAAPLRAVCSSGCRHRTHWFHRCLAFLGTGRAGHGWCHRCRYLPIAVRYDQRRVRGAAKRLCRPQRLAIH